jgi:Ca2+-binding RTX toxin-like protein
MPVIETDVVFGTTDLGGFLPGRFDLLTVGGLPLIVASGGGIGSLSVAANGDLGFIGTEGTATDPLGPITFGPMAIQGRAVGGRSFVYLVGEFQDNTVPQFERGIVVVEVFADGSFDYVQTVLNQDFASVPAAPHLMNDPEIVTVGTKTILLAATINNTSLDSYLVRSNGRLKALQENTGQNGFGGEFDTVTIGTAVYAVAEINSVGDRLGVYRIAGNGTLAEVFRVTAKDKAIFNKIINDIHVTQVGGRTFVFVAENTGGSLLVYEMAADGTLALADHEVPNGDNWRFATELESFEQGGRTFLIAGGLTAGIFEVSPDGGLFEVNEVTPAGTTGNTIYDIDVADFGADQFFYLSTAAGGRSIRSFKFIPDAGGTSGGAGNNSIDGTVSDDRINGLAGNDRLNGLQGDDLIRGGDGSDSLLGSDGNDNLYGENGADNADGGNGNDFVFGGNGNDLVIGGLGNDRLRGDGGNDTIYGGDSTDVIEGATGDDSLDGGNGADTLEDGTGLDTLTGGTGGDMFVLVADGQTDRILDFEDGLDLIDIAAWGPGLQFLDLTVTDVAAGVRIAHAGEVLIVRSQAPGFDFTVFSVADFVFV